MRDELDENLILKRNTRFVRISINFVLIILLIMMIISISNSKKNNKVENFGLQGVYSTDGVVFQKYQGSKKLPKTCKKFEFYGHVDRDLPKGKQIILRVYNLHCNIEINGKTLYKQWCTGEHFNKLPGMKIEFIDSPGIKTTDDIKISIKVEAPTYRNEFIDIFLSHMDYGYGYDLYRLFYHRNTVIFLVNTIMIILGCVLTILLFFLCKDNRKKLYRGLILCICTISSGIYSIVSSSFDYIPMFILNPKICNILVACPIFLVIILTSMKSRKVVYIMLNIFIGLTTVAVLFYVTNTVNIIFSEQILIITAPVYFAIGICATIKEYRQKKNWPLIINSAILMMVFLFEAFHISYAYLIAGYISYYAMLVAVLIQLIQYAHNEKKLELEQAKREQLEKESLQMRVSQMTAQIRPHFLYNVLTTISYLCTEEPKMAQTATLDFADYLRGNLDGLIVTEPIPFIKELEHLETYVSLEKMRFHDRIVLEYDLEVTEFRIPALTIETLVENSIKHNVNKMKEPLHIQLITRDKENAIEIIINDNGLGFNKDQVISDGRSHVGLSVIKERMNLLLHAEVKIESEIHKGCCVTLFIPKG